MFAITTHSSNCAKMGEQIKYPFLDLKASTAAYEEELKAAVLRVIDSGRYIGGTEVEAFEQCLAAATGVRWAVGVANGLDALRLIFRAYIEMGRLVPGDEVIVPANTYIASILAVSDNGLSPVLVEPSDDTLNLDSRLIEAAISERTRAVMTVHLYGRACHDSEMVDVTRRHGLLLIEDNAQAIGARSTFNGKTTGALGDAAAFSFYPTKNIGALGDAGAVTTNDEQLAATVRALANYGSDRRYHNIYIGLNSRLDPIQAAILSTKLAHIDEEIAHRASLAAIYEREINNDAISKPLYSESGDMVWHQYVVRTSNRESFRAYLAEQGVGTDVHYATPPHKQPCYASTLGGLSLPITERIADEVVSLPISRCTSVQDAHDIAAIINKYTPGK